MTVFLSELTTEYLWPGFQSCSILYTSENNQDHGITGPHFRGTCSQESFNQFAIDEHLSRFPKSN